MKKFFLFTLLFFTLAVVSQTMTEKYNSLNNRYEYFNSQGTMIGYKYYDNLSKSWKYYEVSQKRKNNYIEPINVNLVNQALSSRQARLDYNVQKIEHTINDISDKIINLDVDDDTKNSINDRFTSILENLNSQNLNYSSTSVTSQVINWLYSEINRAIKEETN